MGKKDGMIYISGPPDFHSDPTDIWNETPGKGLLFKEQLKSLNQETS